MLNVCKLAILSQFHCKFLVFIEYIYIYSVFRTESGASIFGSWCYKPPTCVHAWRILCGRIRRHTPQKMRYYFTPIPILEVLEIITRGFEGWGGWRVGRRWILRDSPGIHMLVMLYILFVKNEIYQVGQWSTFLLLRSPPPCLLGP